MEENHKNKSIAQNYILNLIYQLLLVVTPLITTPYLSRVLGVKNNGIFGYTFSIVSYFILFGSLGVSTYGQREIAYVQDNEEKKSKIFWEIVCFRFITYFFVIIVYYIWFCRIGEYSLYYKLLIIEMLANAMDITWFFQGIENFKKPVIRNLIVKVLGIILVFLFVKSPIDLWKYFLVYVLSDFIGNVTLWIHLKQFIKIRIDKVNFRKHIKPILILFFPQIAIQIYTVLDKTMIGNITNSMDAVGYYDQAQKIIKALLLIVTALGSVMSSRIAYAYSKKNNSDIKRYLTQSIHMVWLIAVPFILGVIAISNKFVPWYFGKGYYEVISLMNCTTPILLLIGLSNITGVQYLIQVDKKNGYTISVIGGAIANIIFNTIFITKFNAIGAVYASILSEAIVLLIQMFWVRDVITIKDVVIPCGKYLISGIIMFLSVKLLTNYLVISAIHTMVEVLLGGVVYFGCLVLLKDKFFLGIVCQILENLKNKNIRSIKNEKSNY